MPHRINQAMQQLVMSAIGPDRPGLVDGLTELLAKHGANIADSRMINLRGRFAMVLLVEVGRDVPGLGAELISGAERLGLTASVQSADAPAAPSARPAMPYRVRTYAMDQIGLVHRITHALHLRGVNIEELDTRLVHAPHTGAPLFSMDMVIAVPRDVKVRDVRDDLEALCDQLNCDLELERL